MSRRGAGLIVVLVAILAAAVVAGSAFQATTQHRAATSLNVQRDRTRDLLLAGERLAHRWLELHAATCAFATETTLPCTLIHDSTFPNSLALDVTMIDLLGSPSPMHAAAGAMQTSLPATLRRLPLAITLDNSNADSRIRWLEQLAQRYHVRAFQDEFMIASSNAEKNIGIAPWISPWNPGRININTCSHPTLFAAFAANGLGADAAEALLERRRAGIWSPAPSGRFVSATAPRIALIASSPLWAASVRVRTVASPLSTDAVPVQRWWCFFTGYEGRFQTVLRHAITP